MLKNGKNVRHENDTRMSATWNRAKTKNENVKYDK